MLGMRAVFGVILKAARFFLRCESGYCQEMELVKPALKEQYHAGLAMLRECIVACPEDLWTAGKHPRNFWRIAFHVIRGTHQYLVQTEADFVPWERDIEDAFDLWEDAEPPVREAYSQVELLEYLDQVIGMVDETVDGLDLETMDSGFSWYPTVGKLEHQILNIRHLGVHTGQLEELLDARAIDYGWVTRVRR